MRNKLAKGAALLPLLLMSCVSGQLPTLTLAPSTQATSADVKPLVCSEITIVHYSAGKPNVSIADVQAALALPDPKLAITHARNLLGDTDASIAQNQDNNAVWHRLCDPVK